MRNLNVLKKAKTHTTFYKYRKEIAIFGNFIRREKLEHVTTGKICGRWNRGKQREKFLGSLLAWHGGVSAHELARAVGDCRMWRSLIDQDIQQGLDDDGELAIASFVLVTLSHAIFSSFMPLAPHSFPRSLLYLSWDLRRVYGVRALM